MITKGQKINDRYQIMKTIGEGGMANVYLAYDVILERDVAVKVLRGDLSTDEKFVRRFQREALSASSLSHANIVEVYDVGEDNGLYYIVMEYIEGKHLKQLLRRRGTLTLKEVVDIMIQITDGMACAHDAYIIHRDIKPQNIMILDSGLVKITDFGIAMALNSTQLTQTNSVMGSVHYLPPEQASGKGSTMQSDIYSMGILMYELLTGKLPFRGDNAVEIALKQLKEPLPDIKQELPEIPNSIVNVLKKATAKNPKNRYADAREMLEDLKTSADDSRSNEAIIEYKFPEFEDGDRNAKKVVKETVAAKKSVDEEPVVAKKVTEEEVKKENKILLILGAIFTGIVVLVTAIFVVLPKITSVSNVKVPDVTDMEELKAEEALIDEGLKVNSELQHIASDTIEEGKVVKTDPSAGRTVKEGTEVTIYVSSGSNSLTLEDYTGKNYIEIKAILENSEYKMNVIVEKKVVENPDDYSASEIISQSPAAGQTVAQGGTITLYIPDIDELYPDFTTGDYTLTAIQKFADKYNLKLTVKYTETSEVPAGTIMQQSRAANTKVVAGASFTITIAQEPYTDDEEGPTGEEVNE